METSQELLLRFDALRPTKVTGTILTSKAITDYNDFDHTNTVRLAPFKGAKITPDGILVRLPAKAIVTLEIE